MQMACKQAASRPACAMSPVSPANFKNAVMLKTQGNGHFAAGQYPEACGKYVEALHLLGNPSDLVHREEASKIASNLAEAHLRQKDYSMACDAATGAVRLFASNYKALFRRAKAHESLGKLEDAIADLEDCRLVPGYVSVRDAPVWLAALKICLCASCNGMRCVVMFFRSKCSEAHEMSRTSSTGQRKPQNAFERNFQKKGFSQGLGIGAVPNAGELSAWASGLSEQERYEWLVDCYRMRVDDDYAYRGNLRGLYSDEDAGGEDIVGDFWVFCKQAKEVGAIPSSWNWGKFLDTAAKHLRYAFEKSDAQEKWGGENVFQAMMGGRSLRFTGEQIYGSGIQSMEDSARTEELNDHFFSSEDFFADAENFEGLGGVESWSRLYDMMYAQL